MKDRHTNQDWIRISPWVIVGAFIVLVPIFAFMTMKNVKTQQDNMIMLMREKGDALIRSFEAGARTGAMGLNWSGIQIQRLIMETAEQPDILYILITDHNGKILAHNQPMLIGRMHEENLDYAAIDERIQSRQITRSDGKPVFEVYRRFIPSQGRGLFRHRRMTPEDMLLSHMFPENYQQPAITIFVGLDMDPIVKTMRESTKQSILNAVILLLIGFSGIISIIVAYNYRVARANLSRIKAFSDSIVENIPVGLLFISESGRIVTMNNACEKMLRISCLESVSRYAADILPPQLVALSQEALRSSEILIREIDVPVQGKNMLFETSASVLHDDDGHFLGYIILLRDITEIRHLKREMQRKERLASLGSLAAGVAHEIRNPLSSIKGFATYFKERYKDVPEDKDTAEIMIREVERLNRVIGQLLEFARPMNVQQRTIDVNGILRHSLGMIRKQAASQGITIDAQDLADEPVYAYIDQDRIGQVLLNVYLNAIEAMTNGGVLKIWIEKDEVNDTIAINVSDTGCGIPGADIGRVFDPYFTTKQSGTGLGLAIVHKIVEAHGGQVKIASTEEKGTTVSLILPAKEEE
ncbi:MAG TPA: ATP-binding protein [Deltaproteobacteria bacterium]|nr:PAS domain-containing protein [Deltaproteobacteria bacterium]HRR20358.1 ATP-binding protein [Desulfomonilia bacterium]HPX50362.1 ATP-binding protein [Deltaproteobacteria bacterium]HQA71702.1 ATP-binding protein [Deltaproteobacteria bacterium]HRC98801.1 ATP-binding protein [Deltaproteobacteria bacterium]